MKYLILAIVLTSSFSMPAFASNIFKMVDSDLDLNADNGETIEILKQLDQRADEEKAKFCTHLILDNSPNSEYREASVNCYLPNQVEIELIAVVKRQSPDDLKNMKIYKRSLY